MKHGAQVRAFTEALRAGPCTSVGCYPMFYWLKDGTTLSHAAAKAEAFSIARATRDGESGGFAAAAINWEDPDLYCDATGERIESAYAEPESP